MTRDPTVRVRHAEPSDAAELAELGGRTFRATYAADTPMNVLEAYIRRQFGVAQQRAELADPAFHTLLAERGGVLIGYALLHVSAPPIDTVADATIQMSRLYVDASEQGRGVGDALFTGAVDLAKRDGHHQMWLAVWERNVRAIAVYRRWGFADVGHMAFDLAGEMQTDRVLVLRIP